MFGVSLLGMSADANTGKSDCIIYKNDKIVKKARCHEHFVGHGHGGTSGTQSQFTIQGFGKITTQTQSGTWTAKEVQNKLPQKQGYYQQAYIGASHDGSQSRQWHKLNGKKSLKQYRDGRTLAVIAINSDDEFEALSGTPTLANAYDCYTQQHGDMEFCSRSLD